MYCVECFVGCFFGPRIIVAPIVDVSAAPTPILPAPVGGGVAVGPSLIAQPHGGALLSGGKPPYVIDPSMLLEHLRRYWPVR